MSVVNVEGNLGSSLGGSLEQLLTAQDIEPGDSPSYQLCKTIYLYHPLGAKMAESPVSMAQSQEREIAVPNSPEERVRDAFKDEWRAIGADKHIANVMTLSRVYGIASIAVLAANVPSNEPLDMKKIANMRLSFNVFDPLNTSGSLVLNQNPNSLDFLKVAGISVSGQAYHRSRACVMMNEDPVYLGYTTSAFGYVGRSVYQRALFPMKSFIQSMITDDMVTRKAGVLIAKLKSPGSIIDALMVKMAGVKRTVLKNSATNNVVSVGTDEDVETLNMQNLDGAYGMARRNLIENIATACDMPAKILLQETFAEGFGEGTEDAKYVARYIERLRVQMQPLYEFFDRLVMYRAWNPEFYKIIQAEYDGYANKTYEQAFYEWSNSFAAEWPSLLTEPPSEKIKVDDVKLKAAIACVEVLMPALDPENKATVIQWLQDNFNELKLLFQNPLILDFDALAEYVPPQPLAAPGEPKPFAAQDSQRQRRGIKQYVAATDDLFTAFAKREQGRKDAAAARHLNGSGRLAS